MAEQIVVEGAPRATRGKNEARSCARQANCRRCCMAARGSHHAGSEYQAGERDSSLRDRDNTCSRWTSAEKHEPGHPEGLAGGSRHRQFAARGSSARGHGCAHEGEGSRAHVRRAFRRKGEGGVFEVVTRKWKSNACRPIFRRSSNGCQRPGAERATAGFRSAIDKSKWKLLTEPERVLAHVVTLKVEEEKPWKRWRRKLATRPSRSHQEGQEGSGRRRGR